LSFTSLNTAQMISDNNSLFSSLILLIPLSDQNVCLLLTLGTITVKSHTITNKRDLYNNAYNNVQQW